MNRRLYSARALLLAALVAATPACVKLPRRTGLAGDKASPSSHASLGVGQTRIPINRASREELARLPGIGVGLAARIVEHRERYGPFRRPEHLIIVRGISERRFRQVRELISLE